jgi:hypothetical protein
MLNLLRLCGEISNEEERRREERRGEKKERRGKRIERAERREAYSREHIQKTTKHHHPKGIGQSNKTLYHHHKRQARSNLQRGFHSSCQWLLSSLSLPLMELFN